MVRILRQQSDDDTARRRRSPPPDYLSRNVQYRLLMLVGMLMLVILLMERVRDPKVWAWMFSGQQEKKSDSPPAAPKLDPAGKDLAIASPLAPLNSTGHVDRMWEAQVQSWQDVLKVLGQSHRMALRRFLKHVVGSPEVVKLKGTYFAKPVSLPRWQSMVRQLHQRWVNYLAEVDQDLLKNDTMKKQEKAEWVQVVAKLELEWNNEIKVALEAPVDKKPLSKKQLDALINLLRIFDYLDLQQVEDFTIGFRQRELPAWNRLWDVLKQTPQQELENATLGQAQYLQLFRQPEEYRGKLIRIQGVARAGYKSKRGIFVLGVQLVNGPPDPVLVYSLGLPPGFPDIKDKNDQFHPLKLSEPVTVCGYFFKCLRYSTEKGTSAAEAPLVMAKTLNWKARPEFSIQAEQPKTPTLLLGITGVSLFAVAFAWWAWRMSQTPRRQKEATDLAVLQKENIPTVNESLQALEDDDTIP